MTTLPAGYREIRKIDLMRNKREALIVNALALGISAAMMISRWCATLSLSTTKTYFFSSTSKVAFCGMISAFL